ncbi:unnamed protein product [Acanthoscelides obtectus]|uniref:G-protein coupled receptors family 2 profile 2 domain-containing protein n=1 Tax=Acanthoscelides obtectus TaxID=200917 RepID=A0A9P0LZ05_ACAOB|nr:unnamed protein product [Acanthoscelides obtectus]CAK1675460.1 G-protein coupled receptor Mth2 [Acanthoscelides obtectus]
MDHRKTTYENVTNRLYPISAIQYSEMYVMKYNLTLFPIVAQGKIDPCNKSTCIRKCCPLGHALINKICIPSDVPFMINTSYSPNFRFGYECGENKIKVGPIPDFFIDNTGKLSIVYNETIIVKDWYDYCVDYIDSFGSASAIVCEEDRSTEATYLYGMIISMPFLLLTFLVYLIIPEKNLHRKALMFYVICLLLAYVLLVTSNLSKYSFPDVTCHLIGYFIMFFFLGSFLWMNVMCIDMWLTFSGARGYGGTRSTEQKRFLFYCLYAVGVPAMFILFVFLLNTYGDEESIFHPKLGRNKCFLEDGYPQLFYLYLPMATLIGMNIILFILTAIKIQRVKMETAMLKQTDSRKHNYEGDKQQFNLYLKLLFAMGVNWTTEVISWAALWKMQSVPSWIWYLTDLINALYGIFIFFIFVFKKKIWQSLKKRLLWKSSNCTLSSGVSTPHVSDIKLT